MLEGYRCVAKSIGFAGRILPTLFVQVSRSERKTIVPCNDAPNSPSSEACAFERLLNLREASNLLGMHWKTLEGMARNREVPAFRIGGRWRFRSSLLNEWLEKRLVGSGTSEVQWTSPAALRESEEQE
jgi:excisionase family DNA binding protein